MTRLNVEAFEVRDANIISVAWAGAPHVAPREHQPYNGQDFAIGCGHFVHRDSGVDDPGQSAVGANKESTRADHPPGPPGQHLPGPAAHPGPMPQAPGRSCASAGFACGEPCDILCR